MNRNAHAVADLIDIPVQHWPGNCYAIASAILRAGLAPEGTKLRYGHWLGPVSPACPVESFRNGAVFQRHGWLELPDSGGLAPEVIDPTRYVFEGKQPYIWRGILDFYDAGGNALRGAFERPCPPYDPADRHVTLDTWKYDRTAHRFVLGELFGGQSRVTFPMVMWLANLSLDRLGEHALPIYRAIADIEHGRACIPTDNWTIVTGE